MQDGRVRDVARAKRVDVHADGIGVPNRVGKLHFTTIREARRDDVLGDVATHVGRRAVHLGRVLARERATTMPAHAAIGVHDDLAAGEAGVTVWSTHDKLARRVDEELGVLVEHPLGEDLLDDLVDAEVFDGRVFDVFGVLGGDDHVGDLGGHAVHVADRHLALGVGTQPLGQFAGLADRREVTAEAVRKHDRRGHQLGGFLAGVAEHEALVTGALFRLLFAFGGHGVHALADVGALGRQPIGDEHRIGMEHVVFVDVPDATNRLADDLVVVKLRLGGDFTGDDHHVALDQGFAGHAALFVLGQARIKDGV